MRSKQAQARRGKAGHTAVSSVTVVQDLLSFSGNRQPPVAQEMWSEFRLYMTCQLGSPSEGCVSLSVSDTYSSCCPCLSIASLRGLSSLLLRYSVYQPSPSWAQWMCHPPYCPVGSGAWFIIIIVGTMMAHRQTWYRATS